MPVRRRSIRTCQGSFHHNLGCRIRGKTHDEAWNAFYEATGAHSISRREFTSLSLAACVAAGARVDIAQAAATVSDEMVDIRTPSGVCDAALARPQGNGAWPAVILFPDVYGLRPTMREMGRRLATEGYTVLVPNPFYRSTRAPGVSLDSISRTRPTWPSSRSCAHR